MQFPPRDTAGLALLRKVAADNAGNEPSMPTKLYD